MEPAFHIAELNVGRLVAPTHDPRVADFMDALSLVNGLGKRMPGFVWIMEGEDAVAGNTDAKIEGDPLHISNMTVWESVETLERFVFETVHRRFYERRAEWFEVLGGMHFVMWRVPVGHRPTLAEGLERLAHRDAHGDSDHAFGWSWLRAVDRAPPRTCAQAAE